MERKRASSGHPASGRRLEPGRGEGWHLPQLIARRERGQQTGQVCCVLQQRLALVQCLEHQLQLVDVRLYRGRARQRDCRLEPLLLSSLFVSGRSGLRQRRDPCLTPKDTV
jgi:hypothetical protein